MKHVEELKKLVPNLLSLRILDIGCGTGKLAAYLNSIGAQVTGTDIKYPEDKSFNFVLTQGEAMPFKNNSFDFLNLSEVIEHVQHPNLVFSEMHRILSPYGHVYISAPSRFGIFDPHFHLYFVNWLPRILSAGFISIFGSHKDYQKMTHEFGEQRLDQMHYYTWAGIRNLANLYGFSVTDTRERKVPKLLIPLYRIARNFTYQTHHLLLRKIS